MQELRGKVAVVTGGASGIGLAIARAFLGEGMSVVIADIEQRALDAGNVVFHTQAFGKSQIASNFG